MDQQSFPVKYPINTGAGDFQVIDYNSDEADDDSEDMDVLEYQQGELSRYRRLVRMLYQPLYITFGRALYNHTLHQPRVGYFYLQSILSGFADSFNRLWPVFLLIAQTYDFVLYAKQKELLPQINAGDVLSGMHDEPGFIVANNGLNSYNSVAYSVKFYMLFVPFAAIAAINLLRWVRFLHGELATPPLRIMLHGRNWSQQLAESLPLTRRDTYRKQRFIAELKRLKAVLNLADDDSLEVARPLLPAAANPVDPESIFYLLLGTSRLFELSCAFALNSSKELPTLRSRINQVLECSSRPIKLYGRYLQWRLGYSESKKDHLFHLYGLLHLYCKLQWLHLAVDAWVMAPKRYQQAQADCQSTNKAWVHQPLLAKGECSRCGDWEFVAVNQNKDAQSCFANLMKQALDVPLLVSKINQLAATESITDCDLTTVNFASMAEVDLKKLLTALAGLRWSAPRFSCHWQSRLISKEQWLLWLDLWRVMQPRFLRIDSMALDVKRIQSLQQEDFWQSLAGIAMSGCQLDDLAVKQLLSFMPPHLISLDLSHNTISADGLPDFYAANTTSLQYLNLSYNELKVDWSDLIQLLLRARTELRLDFNKALQAGVTNLNLSQQITTQTLSLQACHLDTSSVASLSQLLNATAITNLSIADNLLGEEASVLLSSTTLSRLEMLNYSGNSDIHPSFGMKGNASVWPNLKALDLSRMQFGQQQLSALNYFFSSCRTLALTIQHADLNDQDLLTLLNQTQSIFSGIDFSFNLLTSGNLSLITSSLQRPAQYLHLQHMQGEVQYDGALSQVRALDLSNVQLSERQLVSLAAPGSAVRQLTLTSAPDITQVVREAVSTHFPGQMGQSEWMYRSSPLSSMQANALLSAVPKPGLTTLHYSAAVGDDVRASACRLQSRSADVDFSFNPDPAWQMRTCTSAASMNSPGQLLMLLVLANTLRQLFANSGLQLSFLFKTTRKSYEKQNAATNHPKILGNAV